VPPPSRGPGPNDLAADAFIQSDHAEIRATASNILASAGLDAGPSEAQASEAQARARAEALYEWVYREIEKVPVLSLPSAIEVLEQKRGDCNEHAVLYTALARASGLPTRIAIGVVWSELLNGFYYHAWPEVWVGDRWLWIDPTLGQPVADATHIKILNGGIERWSQLLPYLGRLEIEVVEIR
jgi:transglutaminase-like putative cysteine protease